MFINKRNFIFVSIILLFASLFTGCLSSKNSDEGLSDTFAIMVTDTGGINDHAFNQAAYQDGLMKIKSILNVNVNYIEPNQSTDCYSNLDKATDQKPKIIWGVGCKLADALQEIAQNNPNQQYGLIDYAYPKEEQNIISISFKDNESAFLVGYLAAKLSKTGKIGFIGGMVSDIIKKFEFGYKSGAKYLANKEKKDISVFSQYANSFTDQAKGKDLATKMYSEGCDIIYSAAGAAGIGVSEAAKERDLYFIGADIDNTSADPKHTIACSLKKVGNVMFDISNDIYKQEKFKVRGGNFVIGFAEDAVGIALASNELITEEIKAEIEEVKEKIIKGEINPPYDEETYNNFIKF